MSSQNHLPDRKLTVVIEHEHYRVISYNKRTYTLIKLSNNRLLLKEFGVVLAPKKRRSPRKNKHDITPDQNVTSPLPGTIHALLVKPGDFVEKNRALVRIESMKMENELCAPYDAFVETVFVRPGDMIEPGRTLLTLTKKEAKESGVIKRGSRDESDQPHEKTAV